MWSEGHGLDLAYHRGKAKRQLRNVLTAECEFSLSFLAKPHHVLWIFTAKNILKITMLFRYKTRRKTRHGKLKSIMKTASPPLSKFYRQYRSKTAINGGKPANLATLHSNHHHHHVHYATTVRIHTPHIIHTYRHKAKHWVSLGRGPLLMLTGCVTVWNLQISTISTLSLFPT